MFEGECNKEISREERKSIYCFGLLPFIFFVCSNRPFSNVFWEFVVVYGCFGG